MPRARHTARMPESGVRMVSQTRQDAPFALRAIAFVAACLLLLGAGNLAAAACGLAGSAPALAAGGAAGVAAVLGCVFFYRRGAAEGIFYAALAFAAGVACAVLHVPLSAGAGSALNALQEVAGSYTHVVGAPYAAGGTLGLGVLFALLGVAAGVACAQVALRGATLAAVAMAIAFACAAFLGLVAHTGWAFVFALGVLACFIANTARRSEALDLRALGGSAGLLAGAAVLLGACALGAFGVGLSTAPAGDAIRQGVYSALYGSGYAMPQGRLANLPALAASDRPALRVSCDATLDEYLRGFVGEVYDGSSWQALDVADVKESQGLFYWLSERGFDTNSQLALAARASGFDYAGSPMTLVAQGARGGYAHVPYSCAESAGFKSVTDLATTRMASGEALQVGCSTELLHKAYLLQERVEKRQDTADGDLQAYLDDEAAYAKFARAHYTQLTPEVTATFGAVFGKPHKLDTEQAKAYVLQQLNEVIGYDAEQATPCGGADFATYVLTQTKKGYSVHYATLATLMMRYYGVPARYVEGYRADAEDGAAQGLTLTEQDAHAWVEYYLDGVGWLPFEVTPGFVDYDFYEVAGNVSQQLTGAAWWNSSSMTPWTPPADKPETDTPVDTSAASALQEAPEPWWLALVSFALTLLAAACVRTRIMRARLARFAASLADDTPQEAVPRAFSYALHLAQQAGCEVPNVPFAVLAQQAACEQGMTGELLGTELCRQAARANDRALFSPRDVGEKERATALEFAADVVAKVDAASGKAKRFWLKWVKCVY